MHTLRHAFRIALKTPWLSAIVVLSLAMGIGTNTVVFSWLKGQIFEPLPGVSAPVWSLETKDDTGNYVSTSWLEYRDLIDNVTSFDGIAAQGPRSFSLGNSERASRLFGEFVSANFFQVLGVRPALGRFFRPEEGDRPGAEPVAVISHDFWQTYFRGAPDVIGKSIELNSRMLTVIGVTPERFRGGMNSLGFDVWVPLTMATQLQPATLELSSRTSRPYLMLVQLKPGIAAAHAQGELNAAARRLIETYPETNKGLGYELLPLWKVPRGGQSVVYALATLQVFAFLILIVVCANTANLLLARASVRQREIGVRLALGAGPVRIVSELLAESLVLAIAGAGLGLLIAIWGVEAVKQVRMPANLPFRIAPHLDAASLIFAALLGSLCGVAFGLTPAWQLAHGDILQSLRGGRGSVSGRSRARDLLIGLQVAVALVVLVLAGLFLKSFHNSQAANPGFDADRVLIANVDLGGRGYDQAKGRVFLDQLLQRLAQTPGVARASAASNIPLDVREMATGVIDVIGAPFDPERKVLYYNVTPGYFETMGMPFLEGRDLSPLSRIDLPLDAVINQEMARRYWPNESPIGRRFEISGQHYEIAGVVRNAKYTSLTEAPRPVAWLTMRAQFIFAPTLHVHATQGDPRSLIPAVRAAVLSLDPEIPLIEPRSLAEHVDTNLFMQRVPARMLAVLGPLALALSAIGLYAVLAYSLAQRTQEIAVRLTLGASPRSVVGLMIWQHMRVVLISALVGWLAAFALGYAIRGSLVGIGPGNPLVYAGAPALLLAIALVACWLPARNAAHVDPMRALRAE
ncbi:MAG: ABC transporter permease [Verrucomicrobiota bacterium]|nr:ABC transporter permease [Verrucomicrobiota bacterium]